LRNGASEQVRRCSPTSDSGGGSNSSWISETNNNPTIVETVQEGGSDDGDDWPEGFPRGLDDDMQAVVNKRPSSANDKAGAVCDSGLLRDLAIDTNDPGKADFVINVGALGNASGTPLDGSQHVSFGENAINKNRAVVGDNDNNGMIAHNGSESTASAHTV